MLFSWTSTFPPIYVLEFYNSDASSYFACRITVEVSSQNYISSSIFKDSFIESYLSKKDGLRSMNFFKALSKFLHLFMRFWWWVRHWLEFLVFMNLAICLNTFNDFLIDLDWNFCLWWKTNKKYFKISLSFHWPKQHLLFLNGSSCSAKRKAMFSAGFSSLFRIS